VCSATVPTKYSWLREHLGVLVDCFHTHKITAWAGLILLSLALLLVIFLSLFDWNALRPALGRVITAKTGRSASIEGDLKVHLWSWNPTAEVNGLRLRNPKWADRDLMFGAKRSTINLERDSQGRASWELGTVAGTPNHDATPEKLPTVRRLTIEGGKVYVADAVRKLTFSGSLVAAEESGKQNASAFKIRCSGSLNAKPFRLEANGGSLLDLEPNQPLRSRCR